MNSPLKLIVFGDLHLTRANRQTHTASLQWVLDYVRAIHPMQLMSTQAICLGDLICASNNREPDHRVLCTLLNFFDELSSLVPTATLIGNHDFQYGPEEEEATDENGNPSGKPPLLHYTSSVVHLVTPNTTISRPCLLSPSSPAIGLTPFYRDIIPVPAPLNSNSTCKILFCHGDIAEHPYSNNVILGPSIKDIPVPYIFCGHQHIPTYYEVPTHNRYFEFVGTLSPASFKDAGDHPFGLLDIDCDGVTGQVFSLRRVPNPHAVCYLKHRWLEGQPPPNLRANAHHFVDIEGSPDFCATAATIMEQAGARVRPTERIPEVDGTRPEGSEEGCDPNAPQLDCDGNPIPAPVPCERYDHALIRRYGEAHGVDVATGLDIYNGSEG